MPPRSNRGGSWRAIRGSSTNSDVRPTASRVPPPKDSIALVASISRSSGLQADGDTLKDPQKQLEYWQYILGKLDSHWDQYETTPPRAQDEAAQQRGESRENILILLRKLREGLLAIRRVDTFAVEAYELSLFVAILFESSKYTTALASQLPEIYNKVHKQVGASKSASSREAPSTIALLSTLVTLYPSQAAYHKIFRSFSCHALSPTASGLSWLTALASALRASNFYQMDMLTCFSGRPSCLKHSAAPTSRGCPTSQLAALAGTLLLSRLRDQTRLGTWAILRAAYPQFTCQEASSTRPWLARSLRLSGSEGEREAMLDGWLSSRAQVGEIRRADGIEGRWVVVKKS